MNTQPNLPQKEVTAIFIILIGIIIFILVFRVWPSWYDKKHPQPVNTCKNTTKEVQIIRKIDGGVDSIQTETVYGCEYPDGTFIPAPDLPHEN